MGGSQLMWWCQVPLEFQLAHAMGQGQWFQSAAVASQVAVHLVLRCQQAINQNDIGQMTAPTTTTIQPCQEMLCWAVAGAAGLCVAAQRVSTPCLKRLKRSWSPEGEHPMSERRKYSLPKFEFEERGYFGVTKKSHKKELSKCLKRSWSAVEAQLDRDLHFKKARYFRKGLSISDGHEKLPTLTTWKVDF